MKDKQIWTIRGDSESGDSESGDHYKAKRYDHKPTLKDKKDYIKNETPEDLYIGGDGDFESCVYLTVEKL